MHSYGKEKKQCETTFNQSDTTKQLTATCYFGVLEISIFFYCENSCHSAEDTVYLSLLLFSRDVTWAAQVFSDIVATAGMSTPLITKPGSLTPLQPSAVLRICLSVTHLNLLITSSSRFSKWTFSKRISNQNSVVISFHSLLPPL